MTQELTLDVPKKLWQSSNQRLHHMDRAARTKQLRTLAGWQARTHLHPVIGKVHVLAYISSPRRSRADVGNAYPTIKAILDGLTDAGTWVDDDDDHLVGPDLRRGDPTHQAGLYRVRLVITPTP